MDDLFIDLSVLTHEPEEAYHARAGEYLTSHLLADFRKSPLLYHGKVTGVIPDEDRPAYVLGREAHCRILEGAEAYAERYIVGDGPINKTTGNPFKSNSKAYQRWAAAQGKPVVSTKDDELIRNLAAGVAMNAQAVDLICHGEAEGVVRAEYCAVDCQARLDWVHPHRGIVDLKTCDDLTWFEADSRRYGYVYQLAFYRAVLARVLDGLLVPVHVIAVEKKQPFRCGVWRLGDNALAIAQKENEAAIRRLLRCRDLGEWPTGYEEIRVLDAA